MKLAGSMRNWVAVRRQVSEFNMIALCFLAHLSARQHLFRLDHPLSGLDDFRISDRRQIETLSTTPGSSL